MLIKESWKIYISWFPHSTFLCFTYMAIFQNLLVKQQTLLSCDHIQQVLVTFLYRYWTCSTSGCSLEYNLTLGFLGISYLSSWCVCHGAASEPLKASNHPFISLLVISAHFPQNLIMCRTSCDESLWTVSLSTYFLS